MDYSQKYLKYKVKYDVFKKLNSTNIYSGGSEVSDKRQAYFNQQAESSLYECNENVISLKNKNKRLRT